MIISKSLFTTFMSSPKLAWFSLHDKAAYARIQEDKYGGMDGEAAGRAVEDQVAKLFADRSMQTVEIKSFKNYHANFHAATQQALTRLPQVVYQPGFLVDDCFARIDYLVMNEQGTYDMLEVKAKNSIRKETKEQPLTDEIIPDVSFQAFILRKALGDRFSGKVKIAYINKSYVKNGPIDPTQLIIQEDVTTECWDDAKILEEVQTMNRVLQLNLEEFTVLYPYQGGKYLYYFGEDPLPGSIFTIPRITTNKAKIVGLVERGKKRITDINDDDLEFLKNKEGEEGDIHTYIRLFQALQPFVNVASIKEQFDQLRFPLFFYDYETISQPVPMLEGTTPRQQVVVQYSMHILQRDGTHEHKRGIIRPGATSNREVVEKFVADVGASPVGTFIVRHKGFENVRNDEMGRMYPEFAEFFRTVNLYTYDLMEPFKNFEYFHPEFGGSHSIKNVLPVLTNITYKHLPINSGGVAAQALEHLIAGKLDKTAFTLENLLEYCKLDTRAMVSIYQEILKAL